MENIGNKLDDFEILQKLDKFNNGFVAKVRSKINKEIYTMILKNLCNKKDSNEIEFRENSIKILQNLNNPHISRYITSFKEKNFFCLITESIDGGDLKGYIDIFSTMKKLIPEEELWNIFDQCLSALTFIHRKNLIHRNIKPANIFMTINKTIKIGGFDLCTVIDKNKYIFSDESIQKEDSQIEIVGTPLYMSPEMFRYQPYDQKIDVYAINGLYFL